MAYNQYGGGYPPNQNFQGQANLTPPPASNPNVSARGLDIRTDENVSYRTQGGATHSYSHEERRAFTEFINEVLAVDPDFQGIVPMNPQSDDLFRVVGQGLLLAKLVNAVKPGILDVTKLSRGKNPTVFLVNQNLSFGIQAAKELGVKVINIGPEDLRAGKPHLVLGLLWQIVKIALLSRVNINTHPELVVLLEEHEDVTRFMNVAPEVNLLRWFNFHLRRAGHGRTVNNFSSDIKDGENYLVLLEQIAPNIVPRGVHNEPDPVQRAALVHKYATDMGCGKMITQEDILAGNDKLNLAFTAYLFNKYPGLEILDNDDQQKKALEEAEKALKMKFEEEERMRKLRWEQEEEERRRAWQAEQDARRLQMEREEQERREQIAREAEEARLRLGEAEARLAEQRAREEEEFRRRVREQEEQMRLWEEQKRREEAEREAQRRAEEERKRQFEAEQALLAARAREEEEKRLAELRRQEEEARRAKAEAELARQAEEARRKAEEEARQREAEARRQAEEEEKRRQAAWEEYNRKQRELEQQRLQQIADVEERARQQAWAEYYRKQAEEEERKRREAEAERQRQMAIAAEMERQRRLEEERQRLLALEAERQRQLAMEAERQRQAEEARRQAAWADYNMKQQQAAQQAMLMRTQMMQTQMMQTQVVQPMATVVQVPQPQTYTTVTTVSKQVPDKFPIPRLIITAIRARRLMNADILGIKANPYCVAIHNGRRLKSSKLKHTQDPVWNFDFEFRNVLKEDTINISIYDKALGKDPFLGEVILRSSDFVNGNESWFQLSGREYRADQVHGDINLRFACIYN